MKTRIPVLLLSFLLCSCTLNRNKGESEQVPPDFYLGSWALDLDYESNKAGWLDVRQEDGYLDADLLWRWGSVTPVSFVFTAENQLMLTQSHEVIRSMDSLSKPVRVHQAISWLNLKKKGVDEIFGMAFFPGDDGISFEKVSFTGTRIPEPGPAPDLGGITFGDPVNLLAEDDLSGWQLLEPGAVNGWTVAEGVLTNAPVQPVDGGHIQYGNLRTTGEYEDFNLELEVNVPEGSNSGIYLRGIYEIQVFDSYGLPPDSHHMGALYSRIVPSTAAERPAGEWQVLEITLFNRYLTVKLNGSVIIDNKPVRGVTGGALTADEFIPGPIYLQGDHGKVSYRNIVLTPITTQ